MVRPEVLKLRTSAASALAAALFLMGWMPSALAQNELARPEAESRLDEVTREIRELKKQLEESRTEHSKEQSRLQEIDLKIQKANQAYRVLERERMQHLQELESLERQRREQLSALAARKEQLAGQVRTAYRTGKQSRMKLVLNQDDPMQLGRMLAYFDHVNRVQAKKISALRDELAVLEQMQQRIDGELKKIEDVQGEQQAVLERLGQQRADRAALLTQLAEEIDSEESRLRELERNRRDLEALLERLTNALADIPADLGKQAGIAGQKGALPMPLSGPVKFAFGQNRGGGLKWQGWLIGAETGTEVSAVGYGRVAFADWLRGYGLLIIIDHGQGYLSLYGRNESMLRDAGAWVEPGEVIGIVGSNPGGEQGLYFELRRNGKAIDPAAWMAR